MKNTSLFHDEIAVFVFACLISLGADIWSFFNGKILAYNDALAHLNIARRIIDSLTPGLVQIGSVWLPFLHILELPFVINTFLWQTGLAGTIVSNISFIIASILMYKLVLYLTGEKTSAFISFLIFSLNTNLLYLQTTAMFEPLLILNFVGSIYYLTKWTKSFHLNDLIAASCFTMLATLTRYDGWALCFFESIFVAMICLTMKKRGREGYFLLFSFVAWFGIFLWLIYNQLIFSDAFYFMRSEFSAFSQQTELFAKGHLPTKNNLLISFATYTITAVLSIGIITSFLTLGGIIYYLKKSLLQIKLWTPLFFFTPLFFNIFTLYTGQSVIWLPILPPFFDTYFNARYGTLMIPAAALFVGIFAQIHKVVSIIILILLLLQISLFFSILQLPLPFIHTGTITLKDATSSIQEETIAASQFMKENYKGGLILVSSASSDSFIFYTGLPLKNYITEGTNRFWIESLKSPASHANYIVYFRDKSDRVGMVLGDSTYASLDYNLAYQNSIYLVWEKRDK